LALLTDPRQDTVVLTSGGMWTKEIRPDPGTVWPDGTTYTKFLDSAGGVIDQLDGTVTAQLISFSHPPESTDLIPAGAGFETFLVTDDGPYKIRYGRVIRKEVTFPNAPATTNVFNALQFRDTFQRSALGSKWVAVSGRTSIHSNPSPLPKGVGPNFGLLYDKSAIRWFAPFNGDTVKTSITLLRAENSWGRTTVVLCANQKFTSFLGLQFDTTDFEFDGIDKIRVVIGTGPFTMTTQAQFSIGLHEFDRYTMGYDALTDSVSIYKGTNLTPLLTWVDESHLVPHGPGYRYTGFSWQADLISTGPQITNWIGQDDVGEGEPGS
jgi:hypothetical protein